MKPRVRLTAFLITATSFLTPKVMHAVPAQTSAPKASPSTVTQHMKIDQFIAMSTYDRATYLQNYIQKVMNAVAPINPQARQAVHDYFYKVQPDGNSGLANFTGILLDEEDLAKQGKLDLSKEDIDGIILALVKRDVLPRYTKDHSSPASPTPR